jgi:hypothetical protein
MNNKRYEGTPQRGAQGVSNASSPSQEHLSRSSIASRVVSSFSIGSEEDLGLGRLYYHALRETDALYCKVFHVNQVNQ